MPDPETRMVMNTLMLSAEIERVCGRDFSAQDLYDRAVRCAAETGLLQHQALANELYGKFWLGRGREKIAEVFLSEARPVMPSGTPRRRSTSSIGNTEACSSGA